MRCVLQLTAGLVGVSGGSYVGSLNNGPAADERKLADN